MTIKKANPITAKFGVIVKLSEYKITRGQGFDESKTNNDDKGDTKHVGKYYFSISNVT